MLPLRDEYTLHFLNSLIISLCNSFATSCLSKSDLEMIPVTV